MLIVTALVCTFSTSAWAICSDTAEENPTDEEDDDCDGSLGVRRGYLTPFDLGLAGEWSQTNASFGLGRANLTPAGGSASIDDRHLLASRRATRPHRRRLHGEQQLLAPGDVDLGNE